MGKVISLYQFVVRTGDIVRLPCGVEGEVVFADLVYKNGKDVKTVFVEPLAPWWLCWILWFLGRLIYTDKDINKLVFVRRKEI